ncbi:MAG: protein kinase [Cyanothece sp. SIO1E1]|nr:protein kinase [Cyanothece sp. SIO1E1]
MSDYPDFSSYGYQITQALGKNLAGGRITYLAQHLMPVGSEPSFVVIKQFQFAQLGANWSEYDAHESEIRLLKQLNHPGIPRYLGSYETANGFCLVQEYKPAKPLIEVPHWTLKQIKQIAIAVLEILVYLQQQSPPIIHRDIQPGNILIQYPPDGTRSDFRIYLVDFGCARQGVGDVAVSSVVKGTLGFMPPEQMFNRQLTAASDLYSLGATLICLLSQVQPRDIGSLIDEKIHFKFEHLPPQLNPKFISWLKRMVAPRIKDRYPDAASALQALQPIQIKTPVAAPIKLTDAIKISISKAPIQVASVGASLVLGTTLMALQGGNLLGILGSGMARANFPLASIPDEQMHANENNLPTRRGLYFNGVDDFMEIPHAAITNVGNGDFLIKTRIKTHSRQLDVILDQRAAFSGPVRGYALVMQNGNLGFQLADGKGWLHAGYSHKTFIADGKWHDVMVMVDRDRPNGGKFYIDGEMVGTFDPTRHQGSLSHAKPLSLGKRSQHPAWPGFFKGRLDDVCVVAGTNPSACRGVNLIQHVNLIQ